jgi:hypothetical protein
MISIACMHIPGRHSAVVGLFEVPGAAISRTFAVNELPTSGPECRVVEGSGEGDSTQENAGRVSSFSESHSAFEQRSAQLQIRPTGKVLQLRIGHSCIHIEMGGGSNVFSTAQCNLRTELSELTHS